MKPKLKIVGLHGDNFKVYIAFNCSSIFLIFVLLFPHISSYYSALLRVSLESFKMDSLKSFELGSLEFSKSLFVFCSDIHKFGPDMRIIILYGSN